MLAIEIEDIIKDIKSGKISLFSLIENYEKEKDKYDLKIQQVYKKVAGEYEDDIYDLENRISNLKGQIDATEDENDNLKLEIESLKDKINESIRLVNIALKI